MTRESLKVLQSIWLTHFAFWVKKILFLFSRQKPIILSRTACLGNEIKGRLFGKNCWDFNFQKSRVDMILEEKKKRIDLFAVEKMIPRSDIFNIILRQNIDFFKIVRPQYIFIDSYSELTDQKFTCKDKDYSFFCNYGDVKQIPHFSEKINCDGLMNLDYVERYYEEFMERVLILFGSVSVIFIHFPHLLEKREKMVQRAHIIRNAIESLEKKYQNLHSISLPSDSQLILEVDEMPYHYRPSTYEAFVSEIKKRNILNA